jgi:hypothetical protein
VIARLIQILLKLFSQIIVEHALKGGFIHVDAASLVFQRLQQ